MKFLLDESFPLPLDLRLREEILDRAPTPRSDKNAPLFHAPECYLRARHMVIEERIGPLALIPTARTFIEREMRESQIESDFADCSEQYWIEMGDAAFRAGEPDPAAAEIRAFQLRKFGID